MLSVASLLNPIKSEQGSQRVPSSPPTPFIARPFNGGSPHLPTQSASPIKKQKMTKDGAVFAKAKIKGEVNYAPFEKFDEDTMREIQRFQVYPLGKIREYSRHIPYNSEKKSFLEKTGRESFEGMVSLQFWYSGFTRADSELQSSNTFSNSLAKKRIIL